MVSLGLEGLKANLTDLCAVAKFNDRIRRHFSEEADLSASAREISAIHYLNAKGAAPAQPSWTIYDHCALVTRLYAVYESYVFELMRLWLGYITKILPTWADLPATVCT